MENLPGLKIVGKIDLGENSKRFSKKIEDRPGLCAKLDSCLEKMADSTNREFANFLCSDGRINMDDAGYNYPDKKADYATIHDLETKFAAEDLKIDSATEKDIEAWRKKSEGNNGTIVEKAITVLLHKMLKDEFIVTRASTLDDYRHGVDNLIIDKKTGAVICGFDEVQSSNNEYDVNTNLKKRKILKNIENFQGAFVKYGATFEKGKLKRCSLRNLPTFFLALTENDVAEVTADLEKDAISDKEHNILAKMVSSIDKQIIELYGKHGGAESNINLKAQRIELLERLDELSQRYGADNWSRTSEGISLKKELGVNKLRINLENFKESLKTIKQKA